MGYRNNELGYPKDILSTRAVIKKGNFALIPPNGLVKNVIPGFEGCDITILSSPKLGASFVDYLITMGKDGRTSKGFGGGGIETFAYVIHGKVSATAGGTEYIMSKGGYIYCPSTEELNLKNMNGQESEIFLYKRRYIPVEGYTPEIVCKNIDEIAPVNYEDMDDVLFYNLLPKDLAYDMNFHILSFKPGASHGYIETHVQEHGAYILTGEGMYNLDNNWMPVKKGDYIFMGAYSLQAAYAIGREESFSYIYSKDCNRDELI